MTGLPVAIFIQPAGLPIATSGLEVLRRPVESVQHPSGDVLDQEGEALAEELGAAAVHVHLDVTDSSSWAQSATSASGLIGMPMQAAYSSSKWGLRGLAKTAAVELGRYGIRVNTIHPGVIRSALTAGLDEAMFEVYAVPRIGEPADIGAAVVYLAGAESSFVTGADLPVDGGFILGPVPSAS